ncbi:MAG: hypothetical protein U9Q97_10630 [Acidobacteriota bacterium]|nr:hypothetical protein [Acidobacteriota bacterium]
MNRKIIALTGFVVLLFVFSSCTSKPEKTLLQKYFNALSLNDVATLSTIALEPITIDFNSWEINGEAEETIEPTKLPDMNKIEMELKKKREESIGTTLDAKGEWDDAVFDYEKARTRAAKRAAQKKSDELKIKYDEILATHKNIQKEYNEAKAAAAREEEISSFSLGAGVGDLPNIRNFTGEVIYKKANLKINSDAGTKNYNVYLRKYTLKDEATNITHHGRWIITKFEAID